MIIFSVIVSVVISLIGYTLVYKAVDNVYLGEASIALVIFLIPVVNIICLIKAIIFYEEEVGFKSNYLKKLWNYKLK